MAAYRRVYSLINPAVGCESGLALIPILDQQVWDYLLILTPNK